MVWKQISRPPTIDLRKTKNEEYVGHYEGKHDIQTKLGSQIVYEFVDEGGAKFGLYGFTNLNRAMESVPIDALARIRYLGTEKMNTKFGLKDSIKSVLRSTKARNRLSELKWDSVE